MPTPSPELSAGSPRQPRRPRLASAEVTPFMLAVEAYTVDVSGGV